MRNLLFFLSAILFFSSCNHSHEHTHNTSTAQLEELYDYDVERKISDMGITLTEPPAPTANFVNAIRTGNLIFMAGKGPSLPKGGYVAGKLGESLTVEEGYEAARLVAQAQLSALKAEIGDLNKVVRIVKVSGMVNCTPDFGNQPAVTNGFPDTMVEVFGERGKHARTAAGMASLPRNITVEIEMIVEVQD